MKPASSRRWGSWDNFLIIQSISPNKVVNYYQVLGLTQNCTTEDIKKAYKTYAKKMHPDLHLNDIFFKERFQEVLLAYETLVDSQKRSRYDREFFNNKSHSNKTSESSKIERFINEQLKKQLAEEQDKVFHLRNLLNQEREKIDSLQTQYEYFKRKYLILEKSHSVLGKRVKRKNYARSALKSIILFFINVINFLKRNKIRLYISGATILALYFSYELLKPKPAELVIGTEYPKLRAFAAQGQWTKII